MHEKQAANPYLPPPVNRKIVKHFTLESLYVNELLVAAFVATPYDEKKNSMGGWWSRSYVLITNKRVIFWPRNESNTIESFLHEDILSIGTVKSSVLPLLMSTIILRLRGVERQFDLPKKLLSEAVKIIQRQMAANKALKSFPELELSHVVPEENDFGNTDKKTGDIGKRQERWYESNKYLVVFLLLLPPLGLYGLWKNHSVTTNTKLIITWFFVLIGVILSDSFALFIFWAFSIPIYFLYETTRFEKFTKLVIGVVAVVVLLIVLANVN